MTFALTYEGSGRGAWNSHGVGGTIAGDGRSPGAYFRAPAVNTLSMPGLVGFRAKRDDRPCSINYYAVHRAVMGLQPFFGASPDGVWGPLTDEAVRAWQKDRGLSADGVLGPITANALFRPLADRAAAAVSPRTELARMVRGHVGYESRWDPAAVGVGSPQDVGLGQINGIAHPDMTADQRLNPNTSLPWVANFVFGNLKAMSYVVRDAVAAYNLGKGGARSWIADGRPDVWQVGDTPVYVKRYIDAVLALGV